MPDERIPSPSVVSDPSTLDARSVESTDDPLRTSDEFAARLDRIAQAGESTPDPLHTGFHAGSHEPPLEERPLPELPGYVISGVLGRGGMGVVYRARQVGLDRPVALKMILAGPHAAEAVVSRFQSEARAVAKFQHPNIVQIFDVGTHGGLPYFSLEFVGGGTLAQSIARQPQPPRFAAELVEKLARAMQYAHERGVVHRDLKPANILLDSDGAPKITDFGLAKLIEGESLQTQSGQILGTPSYMAPEQARGEIHRIGPSADVYALGAILYDLLTGRPPFSGASVLETLEMVVQREPVPPSQLAAAIPRDLETICLKSLQKDSAARYSSAAELADDLRRQIEGRPIRARPVGSVERARRWCARNPAVAGAVAFAFLALIVGTVISTWQAIRAGNEAIRAKDAADRADEKTREAQRLEGVASQRADEAKASAKRANDEADEAKRQSRRAQTVNGFMQNLFFTSDPTGLSGIGLLPPGQQGRSVPVSELLGRGSVQIKDQLKDDPLTRAALLDSIGDVSRTLGLYEPSKPLLIEALEIRRKSLPPDHPDVIASIEHLANWHTDRGDVVDAERLYRELLDHHRRHGTLESLPAAEVQLRMSVLLTWCLDDAAIPFARDGLKTRLAILGDKHRDTTVARIALLGALFLKGKESAAEITRLTGAVSQYFSTAGELEKNGIMAAVIDYQSAEILDNLGLNSQAEKSLRRACETLARVWGTGNSYYAVFQHSLAGTLAEQGKTAEAETVYKQCLETIRGTIGLEHPWSVAVLAAYQSMLQKQGRGSEGLKLLDEALQASDRRYGRAFRYRPRLLSLCADLAFEGKDHKSAARYVEDFAADISSRTEDLTSSDKADVWNFVVYMSKNRYPGYLNAGKKLYEAGRAAEARHPDLKFRIELLDNYGVFLARNNRYLEAAPYLREMLELSRQPAAHDLLKPAELGIAIQELGIAEWRSRNFDAAGRHLLDAYEREKRFGNDATNRLIVLGIFLLGKQREDEFLPLLKDAEKLPDGTTSDKSWLLLAEGMSHVMRGDRARARAVVPRIEKLSGTGLEKDAWVSRVLILSGSDAEVKREVERLEGMIAEAKPKGATASNHFTTNLFLGYHVLRSHDAAAKLIAKYPASNTVAWLALKAMTEFRLGPTEATRSALQKELARAENLIEQRRLSIQFDPEAHNATSLLLLRLLCREMREELKLPPLAPHPRAK